MSSTQQAKPAPDGGDKPPTLVNGMTNDERYAMLRSVGEECIAESELRNLIEKKPGIRCYDGFEPSGRMHIAQGIYKAVNVNKCTKSGCTFVFWVADWFALMNDKMGGDLANIRIVGEYLVQVWKAAGMNMENVEFRWAADDINNHANEYWPRVLDIGRRNTVARIKKCCAIMGRAEGKLSAAQILYPLMQCTDIFFLKADICQLGVDQRKVNMLAREYCDAIGRKLKPVILSHHMLAGLLAGQAKMSKSSPDSAIFMEDTAEDVERKILNAACPKVKQEVKEVNETGECVASDDKNPCLEYVKYVILSAPKATVTFVAKGAESGKAFDNYDDVEQAFLGGDISEMDLKRGIIAAINKLLQPVRDHFASGEPKALLEKVIALRGASAAPSAKHADPSPLKKDAEERAPCLVATLPAATRLTLSRVLSIISAIHAFFEKHGSGTPSASADAEKKQAARAVLLLPDWTSFVRNEIDGEEKTIGAALQYHSKIFEKYGLHAKGQVEIVTQSQMALKDPNTYWLTVINTGRTFLVNEVEDAFRVDAGWPSAEEASSEEAGGAAGKKTTTYAGHIIGSLLEITDLHLLQATHTLGDEKGVAQLARRFIAKEKADAPTLSISPVLAPFPGTLCDPQAQPTGDDDYLYADDSQLDMRRKIKKAFARPKDPNCPVLDMAKHFARSTAGVTISRSEADGGNVSVTSGEELASGYADDKIRPQDIKPVVTSGVAAMAESAQALAGTPEMKKLVLVLRNAEKKMSKKK